MVYAEHWDSFANILDGKWKEHDPYDLGPRLTARNNLYGYTNAVRVLFLRAFQSLTPSDRPLSSAPSRGGFPSHRQAQARELSASSRTSYSLMRISF